MEKNSSASNKRGGNKEVQERRALLKQLLMEYLPDPDLKKNLSLTKITEKLRKAYPDPTLAPSRATVARDLDALSFDLKLKDFRLKKSENKKLSKRRLQTIEYHKQNLLRFIHEVLDKNVCWLTLLVQPGYEEGVSTSLRDVYSNHMLGCIPGDGVVLVALKGKVQQNFVQRKLREILDTYAEDSELNPDSEDIPDAKT